MQTFIKVHGHMFEQTDVYVSDGAIVKHYVSVNQHGTLGAISLHRRIRVAGEGESWWLWLDKAMIEAGGHDTAEDALQKGIEVLIEKRDRLTEILEGWM